MKRLKGVVLICLVLTFLFTSCASNPSVDETGDFQLVPSERKFSRIWRYNGTSKIVNIPGTIRGRAVTISKGTFQNKGLIEVNLSEGIIVIGELSFAENQLEKIVIPSTIERIEYNTFCDNILKILILPDGLKIIGTEAFARNKLETIVIPGTVDRIGRKAFSDNILKNITITNGVKTIEEGAFARNQLTEVVIPDSVTTIGSEAFANNNITKVTINNKNAIIAADAFLGNNIILFDTEIIGEGISKTVIITKYLGWDKKLSIPEFINSIPVTAIGERAFAHAGITSVTIPSSVITIGQEAFLGNMLNDITIGSNVVFESNSFDTRFLDDYIQNEKKATNYVFFNEKWYDRQEIEALVMQKTSEASLQMNRRTAPGLFEAIKIMNDVIYLLPNKIESYRKRAGAYVYLYISTLGGGSYTLDNPNEVNEFVQVIAKATQLAIDDLNNALTLAPNNVEIKKELAAVYALSGISFHIAGGNLNNRNNAFKNMSIARQNDPDNKQYDRLVSIFWTNFRNNSDSRIDLEEEMKFVNEIFGKYIQ